MTTLTSGGVGWLSVNSISGALALSTLTSWNPYLCLTIAMGITLVIAFFGHDVVQLFERVAFPLLTVVFLAGTVLVLLKADPGAAHQAVPGAFWIVVGSSFGYTGGWTVGAADYARYLRPDQARPAGWYAAIGNFTSSTVLQIAGVAAVTAVGVGNWNNDDPAASYASLLPGWLGHLTLIAIVIGALSANSVNLYSSSLSFATMGVRLPTASPVPRSPWSSAWSACPSRSPCCTTRRRSATSCWSPPTGPARGWASCSPTGCCGRSRVTTWRC